MNSWLVTKADKTDETVKAEVMEVRVCGAIEFINRCKKGDELVKRYDDRTWFNVTKL